MSPMVRRAGRATLEDGTDIVWSVADGRLGRRWRAMTSRSGSVVEALLLEIDADGRPTRLELTTAAGLLTLHPEPSGSLHGNVVTPVGMRHLTFAWSDEHELAIDRSPIAAAITARRLASTVAVGEGREVRVVDVARDLSVREGARRYVRVAESGWRIEGAGVTQSVTVDDRGLPGWPGARGETSGAGEPAEWPLEVDSAT
jgi:hypothetical protein